MDHTQLGSFIREHKEQLQRDILARQPQLAKKYTTWQMERCIQDIGYHLIYLSEAIILEDVPLFEEYNSWVKVLFEELHISLEGTKENLRITGEVITEAYPGALTILSSYIEGGLKGLTRPSRKQTFISKDNPYYRLANSYLTSLLEGHRQESLSLILSSVKKGVLVKDIYVHVFTPVLYKVGQLWQKRRISVAREHYCTATTQLIMSHLYPLILNPSKEENCRCITLCVSGELHELGIRMIADLLEMEGWDTYHLGANTPLQGVLEMVAEKEVHLLAISSTMTFHLDQVRTIIGEMKKASLPVKIMVGGYPFNLSKDLWKKIGAHAYAPNALSAIDVAKRIVIGTC